jgi:hypothetical protein
MDVEKILSKKHQYPLEVVEIANALMRIIKTLRGQLRSKMYDVWMKPDDLVSLFERIGRPDYTIDIVEILIEDVLSWYRLKELVDSGDEILHLFGDRLATVSDRELCSSWFLTVGKSMPEDRRYEEILSGIRYDWDDRVSYDKARIEMLRTKKEKMIELLVSKREGLLRDEPDATDMTKTLVEFIDLSNACAIWEHLCHFGYVEKYDQEYFKRVEKNAEFPQSLGRTLPADGYVSVYTAFIRASIADNSMNVRFYRGRDTIDIILSHLPLENIFQYRKALSIEFGA